MQSQVRFSRVPETVLVKVWLWCNQVRFNRVPEKVPEKVWEASVQPGQVQQGSGEGSGEGLGGFVAARSGSTGEGSSAWLRSTLLKDL